ncbi:ParB/RepB/Spo0J family partition protein [Veillonella sp.]|uniref:ParB/RepB/Spo0J family partition protein n=1 Tax=Veillonella sp. TaxID=1926307 RepID=UPI0025CCF8CF|nr:ParB/RepB/Spo0J family partition protein [Veillonella sp.]
MPQNRRKSGLGIGLKALIRKSEGVAEELEPNAMSEEEELSKENTGSKKTQSNRTAKSGAGDTKSTRSGARTKSGKQVAKKTDDEAIENRVEDAEETADAQGSDKEFNNSAENQEAKSTQTEMTALYGEPRLEGSVLIEVSKVIPNPNQPRKNFAEDDMDSLVESIRRIGVLQPIIVCKQGDTYQLVAGERRLRASQKVGLELIPALIKDYSSEEVTEIALVENLQRQNLDPIEEAFAYQRLMDTFKQTQDTIAGRLGRSRSYIANIVRLLNLPEFVRNDLSAGEITVGQARPLLALSDESAQREVWTLIKEKELNARQIEALVKRVKEGKGLENKKPAGSIHETAELRAMVDRLKLSIGVKAAIKLKPGKQVQGRIELPFKNEDELNYLIQYMEAQQSTELTDESAPMNEVSVAGHAASTGSVAGEAGRQAEGHDDFIEELEHRPFKV